MTVKVFLLFVVSLLPAGCTGVNYSLREKVETVPPPAAIKDSTPNEFNVPSFVNYQYDQTLIDKLESENEKFRKAPKEFQKADFKNFQYNFGRLKNGEYEKSDSQKPTGGAETYTLQDVFYLDLIGDTAKEAVVLLSAVACGASCDGGRDLVYFYSSSKEKLKLIDIFETGSNSGGCSLKSFSIKAGKIEVEQFGRCDKNRTFESNNEFACKFCTQDETHSVYSISKNGLKREFFEIIETETIDVMNSPAYFKISE